jgi:hypothetical protein
MLTKQPNLTEDAKMYIAITRHKDFFMDRHHQELARDERNRRNKIVAMTPNLSVLHQNIQSISKKQLKLIWY